MARESYRSRNSTKTASTQDSKERFSIDEQTKLQFAEGKLILIDKPLHWTSFDIIKKLRTLLQIKKIGHAGTLDPLATGLLIVCTGKFTKKINEYMAQEKEYTGSFTLGASTATYDLESEPENFKDYLFATKQLLDETAEKFTGEIEQLPPIYSALKQDGVPLYELARKGKEIKVEPRKVTIHQFEITYVALPEVGFKIACTTGTYVRSLANDFGAALGCGAYLSSLRRTKIGEFDAEDAITIEEFRESLVPEKTTSHQIDVVSKMDNSAQQ